MNIVKIVCSLFLMSIVLIITILLPDVSHSYFQAKGAERSFLKAGYKAQQSTNQSTFVFYDDLNESEIGKNQYFFPESKFFIPADSISIAFPLSIAFDSYATTENVLGDLLYANLKMKKLIKEYEDIQERSKQLIWDSQYLFKPQDYTGSIYQITKDFKMSSNQAIKDGNIGLSDQQISFQPSYRHNKIQPRYRHNRNLKPSFKSPVVRKQRNKKTAATFSVVKLNVKKYQESKHVTEPIKNKDKLNNATNKNLVYNIFMKFSNIISYFKTNMLEGILFVTGLGFILLLIMSIPKR